MLTKETCKNYPHVKNWFDKFRIYNERGKDRVTLHTEAQQLGCQIIHGTKCYRADGSYAEVFNGKQVAELKDVLIKWQQLAKHRDVKITTLCNKFKLDDDIKFQQKANDDLKNELSKTKIIFMYYFY